MGDRGLGISKISLYQQKIWLNNQLSNGAFSFYSIAVIILLEGVLAFLKVPFQSGAGICITFLINNWVKNSSRINDFDADQSVLILGFLISLVLSGFFVICGIMCKKMRKNFVLTGIILYAIDGIISFFMLSNIVIIILHAAILFNPIKSIQAMKSISLVDLCDFSIKPMEKAMDTINSGTGIVTDNNINNPSEICTPSYNPNYQNDGGYSYDNDYTRWD